MITTAGIREALQCDNPSCACHKPKGHVHCPAHDPEKQDKTPSLSLTEEDKPLFHCFNGCSQEAVIAGMKKKGIEFKKGRGNKSGGKERNTATPTGLTLEELAKAKGFQVDGPKGLAAWGVAQAKQYGSTVVRIPYSSPDGQEMAVRYRKALSGENRFSWRKGDRVLLYGLGRKGRDWSLLVEGETDCWTAWVHDLPAMGLPGASTWKPEWAEHFKGMKVSSGKNLTRQGNPSPAKLEKTFQTL
jgi:hypothetical protein